MESKNRGNIAFASNNFAVAIREFSDAISLDPENHILFSNRSAAYSSIHDFEAALLDAQQCVKLDATFTKGYSRLAFAMYHLRRYNDAKHCYESGLLLDPSNVVMQQGLLDTQLMMEKLANESKLERIARIAVLPINELLAELTSIVEIVERHSLTAAVYAVHLGRWKIHPSYTSTITRHFVEEVHPMFKQLFANVLNNSSINRVAIKEFKSANRNLHGHHEREDDSWFPRLQQMHPEIQNAVKTLEQDHRTLCELEQKIESGDFAALKEFVACLLDHLNREEMIAVPFMLAGTSGL